MGVPGKSTPAAHASRQILRDLCHSLGLGTIMLCGCGQFRWRGRHSVFVGYL